MEIDFSHKTNWAAPASCLTGGTSSWSPSRRLQFVELTLATLALINCCRTGVGRFNYWKSEWSLTRDQACHCEADLQSMERTRRWHAGALTVQNGWLEFELSVQFGSFSIKTRTPRWSDMTDTTQQTVRYRQVVSLSLLLKRIVNVSPSQTHFPHLLKTTAKKL